MSYKEQSKELSEIEEQSNFFDFELLSKTKKRIEDCLDNDYAVEVFSDIVTDTECNFRYKIPLKNNFQEAKDTALNCMEMGPFHRIKARNVRDFIKSCQVCLNQLVFRLSVDFYKLDEEITKVEFKVLYDKLIEIGLRPIGVAMNSFYYFETTWVRHTLRKDEETGESYVYTPSTSQWLKRKDKALVDAKIVFMEILPIFKSNYPKYCEK